MAVDNNIFCSCRYDQQGQFEWYLVKSEHIAPFIQQHIDIHDVITALEIGCGNSCIADGLRTIVPYVHAFDYAPNVVEQKFHTNRQLELSCMDASKLAFRDSVFDLVVSCASAFGTTNQNNASTHARFFHSVGG